jgi:hypothetical protein
MYTPHQHLKCFRVVMCNTCSASVRRLIASEKKAVTEVGGLGLDCAVTTLISACHSRFPVYPIPTSDQPKVVAETAKIPQVLKGDVDIGNIELFPGNVQAVREVADKTSGAQGIVYPSIIAWRCCLWVPLSPKL